MYYDIGNPSDNQPEGYTQNNGENEAPENIPDTPTERPLIKKIDIEPLAPKEVQIAFDKQQHNEESSAGLMDPEGEGDDSNQNSDEYSHNLEKEDNREIEDAPQYSYDYGDDDDGGFGFGG